MNFEYLDLMIRYTSWMCGRFYYSGVHLCKFFNGTKVEYKY